MEVTIVIPNWNGRKLLEKNLPSVMLTKPFEVIVVDDFSTDNSLIFLKEKYPQVKVIKHSKNLGFGKSCNNGVREAKGEIVVLLNSDVVPEKDFLKYSLPHFKDPQVFAVSFNEPQWSWARIFWKDGLIEHEPGSKSKETHITAWASGGSSAFRKSIWEKLSGFDNLYRPFYWEDIDISYRAWKRGYKVLWEPKSIVHHKHEAVIGKHFSKKYVDYVSQRNRMIFISKNINDQSLLFEYRLALLKNLIHLCFWKPFFGARIKLPLILPKKIKEWQEAKVSDKEVFEKFK
ncbi:MAG: glycosyltransferase family 2 protein [bacterium]|nr:glycosyltransferase family 2 protein [bacterium]